MGEAEKLAFTFGDFRLGAHLLEHRGALVPLAPKAVDLLYLLASHAPAIVTKEEIFEAVWPGTFVVESSLARNVSVIRKALEERAEGPFIETIPKRGYRFVAPVTGGQDAGPGAAATAGAPAMARRFPLRFPRRWLVYGGLAAAAAWAIWIAQRSPSRVEEAAEERIGHHILRQGTPAAARKAVESFEKAAREQPNSAGAHAGLAQSLAMLPTLGAGGTRDLHRAREEARLALKLDAKHPSALLADGLTRLLLDWDLSGAESAYRRVLALDPKRVDAYFFYAQLLSWTGRGAEAVALLERARRIDPVSPVIGAKLGHVHYEQKQFDRAAAEFQAVLEREPHYSLAHYYLGLTYGFLGRYEEAERELAAAELNPGLVATDRAWLRLRQGDAGPARRAYADMLRMTDAGQVDRGTPLLLAVALGDFPRAYRALAEAAERREAMFLGALSDPRLEALRRDAGYAAFLAKRLPGARR